MPKTRIRSNQPGAKSEAQRIKHKIGGRKSTKGAKQISDTELAAMLRNVRKRDRNKLRRTLIAQGFYLSLN